MKILVDADSCPRDARELVVRSSNRRGIRAIFAANRPIRGIAGENITFELCPAGENAADDRIAELAEPGDLAVTRDLALAKRLLEKGLSVIDDRGRLFSLDSINELLSLRDFAVSLAENGLGAERTASYGKKERKTFADSLDRQLTKHNSHCSLATDHWPLTLTHCSLLTAHCSLATDHWPLTHCSLLTAHWPLTHCSLATDH